MKKMFIAIIMVLIAGIGWSVANHHHAVNQTAGHNAKVSFDKTQHSLTDPTSIWVIVNKARPLTPKTYAPSDLIVPNVPLRLASDNEEMHMRAIAGHALESMFGAAKQQGVNLMIASGYRSYPFQVNLYNRYVQEQGKAVADSQSARPGYSEHQTGLAVDVEPASRQCEVDPCFANTPEGQWLAANAYKYGFIIRYPNDKQSITGYIPEPWHVRYIGKDLSSEMHNEHITTLEEFFGLPAAPDYK